MSWHSSVSLNFHFSIFRINIKANLPVQRSKTRAQNMNFSPTFNFFCTYKFDTYFFLLITGIFFLPPPEVRNKIPKYGLSVPHLVNASETIVLTIFGSKITERRPGKKMETSYSKTGKIIGKHVLKYISTESTHSKSGKLHKLVNFRK